MFSCPLPFVPRAKKQTDSGAAAAPKNRWKPVWPICRHPAFFFPTKPPPLLWAAVYLQGDLGAGKTTFTRGLLHGFGHRGTVKSPTYALVESYRLPQERVLHHFDLYRFADPSEWEDAGLDDLFADNSICLIEWPLQGGEFVPAADYVFDLRTEEGGRRCSVSALSAAAEEGVELWRTSVAADY